MFKKAILKLWDKKVTIISIIIILVSILPMLYFFKFSILGGDDFLYGRETYHTLQDTGSYFNVMKIAWKNTAESYMHWQGSFFSLFLMYLQPGIISLNLYRVVLCLMFVMGIVSPCIMAFTLNKHYLRAPKKYIWLILCVYIFAVTQYMPSIFQAYYWYNAAIYYQFTLNITFLFVAALASFHNAQKNHPRTILFILIILMTIMIGGSNFPIGLVFAVALFLFTLIAVIKRYDNYKAYILIFAVFTIIFLINVLAPGNGARQGIYSVKPNLFMVAFTSVRDMLMETPIWIKSTITLGVMCALIPFSKKITANAKMSFIHPALAGLVIFLLLLAQYVPVEYGLGSKGPARVENLRFMLLNIGLWLFFINMAGYYRDKEIKTNKFVIVILSIFLISTATCEISVNKFTSYKMLDQIANKELQAFGTLVNTEVAKLEDKSNHEPVSLEDHTTNEFLHPDTMYWFYSGIWDYYRKVPLRTDKSNEE